MRLRILEVPSIFKPKMTVVYPPHQLNSPMIEERAFKYFSTKNILSDLIYVPIQWTQYHINNNYGKDKEELQKFCYEINLKYPKEKFFTVVQYDGGTLVSLKNCKIFACSGGWNSPKGVNSYYEPIPLLSEPHKITKLKKNIFASFVGTFQTNSIRIEMRNVLKDIPGFKIKDTPTFFKEYIYKNTMLRSIFALCPRGYGPATFRMYEAIQMGVIPIYISNEFWLPFQDSIQWSKVALLIKDHDIKKIPKMIEDLILSQKYLNFLEYTSSIYKDFFTWEGCLEQIKKKICY